MIRIKYDLFCKNCGAGDFSPRETWTVRALGNTCRQCGGELGTKEEWEQARREAVGIPALEARIKALEARIAEPEKGKKK